MAYPKRDLMLSDKETLLQLIDELQRKLKKKNIELNRVRTNLSLAKSRVIKMKDTIAFQRKRIIELHS